MYFEWCAAAVATPAAVIDLRTRRIPNALTYSALALGLIAHLWIDKLFGLGAALAAALIVALPFLPLVLRGGMGGGDLKLALALGAILGTVDGAMVLLLATAFAGAALALVAALHAKRFFGVALAYGPAFAVGAWVVVFWRRGS